jgi:hypothetical protein
MGKIRNACGILIGISERKRPRGKPSLSRENNIRMDLREIQ